MHAQIASRKASDLDPQAYQDSNSSLLAQACARDALAH